MLEKVKKYSVGIWALKGCADRFVPGGYEENSISTEEAIGKQIKCGDVWLRVIGVLKSRGIDSGDGNLGIDDFNMNVYAPIQTALLRFNDRSVISKSSLVSGRNNNETNDNNRNQLDKIVVQVKEAEQLQATANVLQRMLERRHAGAKDFRVIVPELLLKQEQKTRNIFSNMRFSILIQI